MLPVRSLGALAIWGMILAAPVSGQDGQIRFVTPPGWTLAASQGSRVLSPSGLGRRDSLEIVVLPEQPPADNIADALRNWARLLAPPGTSNAIGQIEQSNSGRIQRAAQVFTVNRTELRLVSVVSYGTGMAVILIAASSEQLVVRYRADIESFLASLDFPGSATPPPAPTPIPSSRPAPQARPASLPQLQPKPGHVIGRIYDSAGRPMMQAEVEIRGVSLLGAPISMTVPAENGEYEIEVPDGIYSVIGYALVDNYGRRTRMQLDSLDGRDWRLKLPSKKGIVKDFALRLSGVKAGHEADEWGTTNYGGSITVEDRSFTLPPGALVTVTLTPIGPLLDGSQGQVLRRSGQIVFTITDVPLGKYAVSVTVQGRPSDFEIRHTGGGPVVGRGPLVFLPNEGDVQGVRRVRLLVGPG